MTSQEDPGANESADGALSAETAQGPCVHKQLDSGWALGWAKLQMWPG